MARMRRSENGSVSGVVVGVLRWGARACACLGFLLVMGALPAVAREYSAIVIDVNSGTVLHQADPDGIRYPASLTKMMTLYLTFDQLKSGELALNHRLPVSAHAQSMSPTKLGVRAGQTLGVEQAILALVTKSANDAAVVLAEAVGGSEEAFARKMTQKARQLGMSRTTFRNASGLPDPEQVSTARDLATLALALQRDHKEYYPYFATRAFRFGNQTMTNHNHLMERYAGMDGLKTGYIQASGFNLAASATRGPHRLVGVVMGGKSAVSRDNQMASLLDDAFADLRRGQPGEELVAAAPAPTPARRSLPPAKPQTISQLAASIGDAEDDSGSWAADIGSFSSKAKGQTALTSAKRHVPKSLARSVEPVVQSAKSKRGTTYRARFEGLNEAEARSVCTALKRAGQSCSTVAPGSKRL